MSCLREPQFRADPQRVTTQTVPRTWHERLLTWPWRPWITEQTVTRPDPNITFDAASMTYIGHPSVLRELRRRTEVPSPN